MSCKHKLIPTTRAKVKISDTLSRKLVLEDGIELTQTLKRHKTLLLPTNCNDKSTLHIYRIICKAVKIFFVFSTAWAISKGSTGINLLII